MKAVPAVGMGFKALGQQVSGFSATLVMLLLTGLVVPQSVAQISSDLSSQASAQGSSGSRSATADAAPTSTELSVATDDSGPRTHAKFTVRVSGGQGGAEQQSSPAGVVTLSDARGPVASAALDPNRIATFDVDALSPGENRLVATYSGTASESPSTSPAVVVNALASGIPDFNFALSPTALSVKAGTDGTTIATISPTNGFNQLVSLSCAGNGIPLPVGVTCLFTPINLVTAGSANLSSSLSIQTLGVAGKTSLQPLAVPQGRSGYFAYAILIPGIIAFAGLNITRKRAFGAVRLLSTAMLLLASVVGLGSCAARYHYLHNPPAANNGTPLGTYTLVITASSSSGSSITIHSQNIALTVN